MRRALPYVLFAASPAFGQNGFRSLSLFIGSKGERLGVEGEEVTRECKRFNTCDTPGAYHSQAAQDKAVKAIFDGKRDGYFVDLAANHPIAKSNTRTLERDFGWRGLCIDGNEEFLMLLLKRRSCQVVGAIVSSDADAYVDYRRWTGKGGSGSAGTWQHALSGIVGFDNKLNVTEDMNAKHVQGSHKGSGVNYRDVKSASTRLEDILRKHNAPSTIEYLSLDVEGAEEMVMRSFPFQNYIFHTVVRARAALHPCSRPVMCLMLPRYCMRERRPLSGLMQLSEPSWRAKITSSLPTCRAISGRCCTSTTQCQAVLPKRRTVRKQSCRRFIGKLLQRVDESQTSGLLRGIVYTGDTQRQRVTSREALADSHGSSAGSAREPCPVTTHIGSRRKASALFTLYSLDHSASQQ